MNNESAYVAFLDIMGFSDLIERNSQEKLVEIYRTILNKVYSFLPTLTDREERETVTVNSFIIQDSIILWIRGSGFPNLVLLLGTVQILLNFGFKEGLPIRGGISQGKISILNEDHKNYSVRSILGPHHRFYYCRKYCIIIRCPI
ncbi:MAG: hypothetical protein HWN65_22730 [Candidatus Helarchaeota archaeon]|nr:hypothetical protein [Candidatus Helarchaeota archaeon]